MNKHRHTNTLYSGVYIDDSNQMVLFDNKELPLLVNPNKVKSSTAKKIKREVVGKWLMRYAK